MIFGGISLGDSRVAFSCVYVHLWASPRRPEAVFATRGLLQGRVMLVACRMPRRGGGRGRSMALGLCVRNSTFWVKQIILPTTELFSFRPHFCAAACPTHTSSLCKKNGGYPASCGALGMLDVHVVEKVPGGVRPHEQTFCLVVVLILTFFECLLAHRLGHTL